MKGPQFLLQNVGKLKSRMGGCVPGSHATFRGLDLHGAFKDADWIDLYLFGITGRRFNPEQLKMLQALWTYTSYPDARLWNNRVAALAGSSRSTGALGIAAALAVSEARIYGGGIYIPSITFLHEAYKAVHSGGSIAECVKNEFRIRRGIAGYGRPLTSKDERIVPILDLARKLGMGQGPHLLLAQEIDEYLATGRWRMRMNYAAISAAIAADMGLSPREYYLYVFPAFMAGMLPCYIEAVEKPEGALFPIPCEHIAYTGKSARTWG